MKKARIVIGANFGDEGKGLFTDFFAAKQPGTLVVRHNGGAQAGHTVTLADGRRHVFSHFGSGTFAGADTFLSRFFVANPLLFFKEQEVLAAKTSLTKVYIDREAPLTTPYDMLINQLVEEARGTARHGSCGVGFGETIERNLRERFKTTVGTLASPTELREKMLAARCYYVPERLKALGVETLSDTAEQLLANDGIIERFILDAEKFLEVVTVVDHDFLETDRPIVFEGAQGLLLDQDRGFFPHVTRSNTGIKNALLLATEAGIGEIEVTYPSRIYMTRHGAGPMGHELSRKPYPGIVDETNVPNDYQGTLRFGHLDLNSLAERVNADLSDASAHPDLSVSASLGLTCIDQVDGYPTVIINGAPVEAPIHDIMDEACRISGIANIYGSRGPTRDTIALERVGCRKLAA